MGHSLGEDVAACVAGVFSLEDALALVAKRGRLMQDLPRDGEMVAVFASEQRVRAAIEPYRNLVSVAAINGAENITISGERRAVSAVVAVLQRDGARVRPVKASHAYHSPQMDPMLDAFERAAAEVAFHAPTLPLVSSVTGNVVTDQEVCDPRYWRRHVRETVKFEAAVKTLWDRGCRVFVEIGPNPVLLGIGARVLPDTATWVPSLRRGRDDAREMRASAANLYAAGVAIKWDGFHQRGTRRRLALPTYPFQRQRYWSIEPRAAAPATSSWDSATAASARQAAEGPLDSVPPDVSGEVGATRRHRCRLRDCRAASFEVFTTARERYDAAALRANLGIAPMYEGLLRLWLETLAVRGYLRRDGGHFVADAPLRETDPQALVAASAELFADFPAPLEYLTRCGDKLVDLLAGRESPLEMLFPNGSTETADGLYNTSPLARYSNAIARAAVSAAAAGATPGRPLRVLEIGAGTGGTTAGLLAVLPPSSTRYCFTDVGSLFLGKAQDRFAIYPFITYRTLDIEKHPREQGFEPHSYDVVVAANVLHATRNLHDTLEHVSWLLAPGGLLKLCEATRHPFWLERHHRSRRRRQRFSDDFRTDVPLIAPK